MREGPLPETPRRPPPPRPPLGRVVRRRPFRLVAANDNVDALGKARLRFVLRGLVLLLVLAAVLALAGCGRRGAPELPASAKDEPRVPIYPAEPGGDTVPDRKFVLDPILQ